MMNKCFIPDQNSNILINKLLFLKETISVNECES